MLPFIPKIALDPAGKIPPFLCQLIPNDGTEIGFKLNEPLIEILGNFNLGKDHSKLKNDLILSIAVLTASLAPPIVSLILVLILVKVSETVV